MTKSIVPSKPMSFAAQLANPVALTLDWYMRHPSLKRVTLHVEGLEAEDVAEDAFPDQIRDALVALDGALAAYVQSQAGLPCAPAVAEPIEAEAPVLALQPEPPNGA